ncbi:MAG: MarR family transcriptional regulator [Bacteroidetes bacterium]|nr:MarR family transcriptional regulator [Bacteroidota bacterium]
MKKRLKPEFELAFEDAAQSTGFLFWQLNNMWQRKFREEFEKLGLTHVQFLLLNSLAAIHKMEDKPVTQAALADHSGCDKMMVSKVIRALEDKKLIMRKNHHADSRSVTILLSTKGMELLKEATTLFSVMESEFFKPLKGKEKDVEKRIRKMLKKK